MDAASAPRSSTQAAVLLRLVTHTRAAARGRGARAAEVRRLAGGEGGHPPVRHLGCGPLDGSAAEPSATSPLGSNSISLPKPRESTAKSANPRGGAATTKPSDFQVF